MSKYLVVMLGIVLFHSGVMAREGGHAHVHGAAHLNVAAQGDELYIELLSPAINIVGFEHRPRTPQQKRAIKKAMKTLKAPQQLFEIDSRAGCRTKNIEVESELAEDDHHGHEHKHEHKHEHAEADEHSDFQARYTFSCKKLAALRIIKVTAFTAFPGISKLNAKVVSTKGQQSHQLAPGKTELLF